MCLVQIHIQTTRPLHSIKYKFINLTGVNDSKALNFGVMLCLEEVKSIEPTSSQSHRVASQIQLCIAVVATSKLQANSIQIAVIYSLYLVIYLKYLIIYLSVNLNGKATNFRF